MEAHFVMNIEQDIYDFLFHGIDELKEIAAVYTDKKIEASRNKKNFSMNVSLEDDYLNINFEIEDMTIEWMVGGIILLVVLDKLYDEFTATYKVERFY